MNYRHGFHAGNFADVVKHATLARIVSYLRELAELANSGASWSEGIAVLQRKYDNKPVG